MGRLSLWLTGAVALVVFSGCAVHHHHGGHGHRRGAPDVVVVQKPGPPPHAPAHGYRHRHHHHADVELVFDAQVGVYAVVGYDGFFFHHDYFYRVLDGIWHRSLRLDGGWAAAHVEKLPPGLAKKRIKARHKRHKRHGHPAKYGD